MKKLSILIMALVSTTCLFGQEFDKNLASAKSAYGAGKLEDARFAMEQMLRELDIAIGKEIMKLLPVKIGTLGYNAKEDNVTGGTAGGVGLMVHRTFGAHPNSANIEVINNSPLINSLNAMLSMPMMGGMMTNENQKQIKVQGYKSILTKNVNSETGKTGYELQVPMNNTLITIKMDDTTEGDITSAANGIPLSKIAQLAQ